MDRSRACWSFLKTFHILSIPFHVNESEHQSILHTYYIQRLKLLSWVGEIISRWSPANKLQFSSLRHRTAVCFTAHIASEKYRIWNDRNHSNSTWTLINGYTGHREESLWKSISSLHVAEQRKCWIRKKNWSSFNNAERCHIFEFQL